VLHVCTVCLPHAVSPLPSHPLYCSDHLVPATHLPLGSLVLFLSQPTVGMPARKRVRSPRPPSRRDAARRGAEPHPSVATSPRWQGSAAVLSGPDAGTQSVVSQFHADMESMGWKVCAIEVARLFVLSDLPTGGTRDYPVPPSMSAAAVGGGGDDDDEDDVEESDEDEEVDEEDDEQDDEDEEEDDDDNDEGAAVGGLAIAAQPVGGGHANGEGRIDHTDLTDRDADGRVDCDCQPLDIAPIDDSDNVAREALPAVYFYGAASPVLGTDLDGDIHLEMGDTGLCRPAGRGGVGEPAKDESCFGNSRSCTVCTTVSVSPGVGQSSSEK